MLDLEHEAHCSQNSIIRLTNRISLKGAHIMISSKKLLEVQQLFISLSPEEQCGLIDFLLENMKKTATSAANTSSGKATDLPSKENLVIGILPQDSEKNKIEERKELFSAEALYAANIMRRDMPISEAKRAKDLSFAIYCKYHTAGNSMGTVLLDALLAGYASGYAAAVCD